MTQFVIVRADLPMGFAAAQVVHATGESVEGRVVVEGTNAVVLAVAGEPKLLWLAEQLAAAGIPHVLVREPDAPWLGQATAIGLPPLDRREVILRCPALRRLSLYGCAPKQSNVLREVRAVD